MNVNSVGNKASISVYIIVPSDAWHARLGHVIFSSIKNMMDLRLIPKSELVPKICEVCIQSKFTRRPFKSVEICSEL